MKDNVVHEFLERRAEQMGVGLEEDLETVDDEERVVNVVGGSVAERPEYDAMLRAIRGQWVSHYAGPDGVRISFRKLAVRPWFVVLSETVRNVDAWKQLVRRTLERQEIIDRLAGQYGAMKPEDMSPAVWRGVVAASLKGMTMGPKA